MEIHLGLMVFNVQHLNWSSAVLQLSASGVTADYQDYNPNFLSLSASMCVCVCVCVCVKESVCEEKRRGKRPTSSFFPDSVNTNSAVQRGLQECFGAFRECESNYDFCLCAESENRHAERSDTLSAERLRVPTIRPVRAQAALNSGCTWRGRESMKRGGQRSRQRHRRGFI